MHLHSSRVIVFPIEKFSDKVTTPNKFLIILQTLITSACFTGTIHISGIFGKLYNYFRPCDQSITSLIGNMACDIELLNA